MKPIFLLFIINFLTAQPEDVYSRPFQADPDFDFDVTHYDINLKINDHEKTFSGKTSVSFVVLKSRIEFVTLDAETYRVTMVFNGEDRLKFTQGKGALVINPLTSLYRGQTRTYTIFYESDGKVADPKQFGMNGVKVLGLGFFGQSEDNPALVQTHSFPEGARHWFPSNDHPGDKATSMITTTVRSDWKVLSNGVLKKAQTNWKKLPNGMRIKTQSSGDSTTYSWSLDLPNSTYLFVMVAGPYTIIQDYHEDIPMSYWVYPQDVGDANRSFFRTPEIMKFFEKEYLTAYPWPKMDQITIPGIGGGAESTSATILGQSTIHDKKAEKDFPSHWLVAHEAAHQWWGDYITMQNWQHAWLNESFATYGEYLYSSKLYGEEEGQINLWKKKQSYCDEFNNKYSRPMVHPYWKYPNQNFDSHIYPRGAAVLHMLREITGDKVFKQFQKVFLAKFGYGNPETKDLIAVVNEVSEQDLEWFFDQWVLSAGHPVLDVKSEWDSGVLTVYIDQTQSGKKVPNVYRIPAKIAFYAKNEIIEKSILIDRRKSIHRFDFKKEPLLVRFDPDNDLLINVSQNYTVTGLVAQLKRDNVIRKKQAADKLKNHLDDSNVVDRLKRAAIYDKSWFVRKACLEAVGEKLTAREWAIAYTRENHSQPRKSIIIGMFNSFPKEALKLIRKNIEQDDSYVVQSEMINQLGINGNAFDLAIIKKLNKQRSPRKILQKAALKATESIRGR